MRCTECGWPLSEGETISTHRTSEGQVSYLRCPCGAIAVRLRQPPPSTPVIDVVVGRGLTAG
ncbi:hypothetical protein [Pseudonocardia acaciae]|uniref:hypothetical protein n=1 Tax=Pseudonocardia acaciae TaxID=551276 RepID=UPI00055E3789|nr:hypothetical protein [Pseudonocardia acaciae]